MKITSSKKTIILGISVFLVFFILSAVGTFSALAYLNNESISISPLASLTGETSKPKFGEETCPLNGVKYSKEMRESWEKRRPLGVMIENHTEARPQSGLSRADVVYEAVAEGGITRFLAMFYCQDAGDLAPVRSARVYFLDWLSEYGLNPLYAHVGGANAAGPADALGFIRKWGWTKENDMDQFSLGFPTYWRGSDKPAPHNVHSTTQKIWEAAEKRGYADKNPDGKSWNETFTAWNFKDEAKLEERPASASATVNFWNENDDFTVEWKYDKDSNTYKRFQSGSVQKDALTDEELAPKVVIVQSAKQTSLYDNEGHLLYKTTGSGEAIVLQDGKAQKVAWKKTDRESKTRYYDIKGNEITFNRGQIWIQTVPTGAVVKY
jgi:hypothetical protein